MTRTTHTSIPDSVEYPQENIHADSNPAWIKKFITPNGVLTPFQSYKLLVYILITGILIITLLGILFLSLWVTLLALAAFSIPCGLAFPGRKLPVGYMGAFRSVFGPSKTILFKEGTHPNFLGLISWSISPYTPQNTDIEISGTITSSDSAPIFDTITPVYLVRNHDLFTRIQEGTLDWNEETPNTEDMSIFTKGVFKLFRDKLVSSHKTTMNQMSIDQIDSDHGKKPRQKKASSDYVNFQFWLKNKEVLKAEIETQPYSNRSDDTVLYVPYWGIVLLDCVSQHARTTEELMKERSKAVGESAQRKAEKLQQETILLMAQMQIDGFGEEGEPGYVPARKIPFKEALANAERIAGLRENEELWIYGGKGDLLVLAAAIQKAAQSGLIGSGGKAKGGGKKK